MAYFYIKWGTFMCHFLLFFIKNNPKNEGLNFRPFGSF